MPRFVILEHHHHGIHWDFMLESGGTLRTWRLESPPRDGDTIRATPLGDHRIIYLDYEGAISGERGSVTRWDQGEFAWVADEPQRIEIMLRGDRVSGRVYLCRGDSGEWMFRLTSVESAAGDPTA